MIGRIRQLYVCFSTLAVLTSISSHAVSAVSILNLIMLPPPTTPTMNPKPLKPKP